MFSSNARLFCSPLIVFFLRRLCFVPFRSVLVPSFVAFALFVAFVPFFLVCVDFLLWAHQFCLMLSHVLFVVELSPCFGVLPVAGMFVCLSLFSLLSFVSRCPLFIRITCTCCARKTQPPCRAATDYARAACGTAARRWSWPSSWPRPVLPFFDLGWRSSFTAWYRCVCVL